MFLVCVQSDGKFWVIEGGRTDDLEEARDKKRSVMGEERVILTRKKEGYFIVQDDGTHAPLTSGEAA